MNKKHFVRDLIEIEESSYNAIVDLFKANKILLLDFTGSDVDIEAFSYNDDETATNVKIVKIELDETGCLDFIDSTGFSHSSSNFHIGSMPYIYESVLDFIDYSKNYDVKGNMYLPKNDFCETIEVKLTPGKYPVAYKAKIDELMEQGAFNNRESAERWVMENPICLELIYEKHSGLFAVESEAIESNSIVSPYSKNRIVCD